MAPKTAFLHIGTPKTGTTSIQTALTRAQNNGDLAPVSYPLDRSGDGSHWRLATLYLPHRQLPHWIHTLHPLNDSAFRTARERYRRFLFSELQSAPHVILSAELLSKFTVTAADRLRADLEALGFREFHVLLYIREPADFFLSELQQNLKSPFDPGFPADDPGAFRYAFRAAADTWEQVFPGRLIVRKYRTSNDVVEDFAGLLKSHMGVSLAPLPARMNTTLSAEGMHILHAYRQTFWPDNDGFLTPDTAGLVGFLEQSTNHVTQTQPSLKAEFANLIRANHRADAELIHARYGVDLNLADTPSQPAPTVGPKYHVDDILETVNPRIVDQLLLLLAKTELSRLPVKQALPLRLAARAYRSVPRDRRPPRLDAWLRTFAKGEL